MKVSNSWCGALPFSSLLDTHLQKGSVCCICNRVSRHSVDSVFGVTVGSVDSVGMSADGGFDELQLLVLKAGPSEFVAVSMWMVDV